MRVRSSELVWRIQQEKKARNPPLTGQLLSIWGHPIGQMGGMSNERGTEHPRGPSGQPNLPWEHHSKTQMLPWDNPQSGREGRHSKELRSSETQIGLPSGSGGKEPAWQETLGDAAPVFVSDRAPGGGHGNPLQDSCLEHSVDRGAWCAMVYSHIGSQIGHSWSSELAASTHSMQIRCSATT